MIKAILKIISKLSVSKTIYYNLKYLPLSQAIHFPLVIERRVTIKGPGKIRYIPKKNNYLHVRIGAGIEGYKTRIYLNTKDSELVFHGAVSLFNGISININDGKVTFFENSSMNFDSSIDCWKTVQIGSETMISAHCYISDTDCHSVIKHKTTTNLDNPIYIGNHVWIGFQSIILKGSIIADNSIVAAGSLVNKQFKKHNLLIGGSPARVLDTQINWTKEHPNKPS